MASTYIQIIELLDEVQKKMLGDLQLLFVIIERRYDIDNDS